MSRAHIATAACTVSLLYRLPLDSLSSALNSKNVSYTWFPQGGVMECSRLLTHVNDAITTHYDHSMMCNDAVTAP